jgi:hypothetical protein
VSRLRALCCCNTDPNSAPCLQWVQGCIPQFPVTVTLSFSGSYRLEQIDLCNPTAQIVTVSEYVTYSGSVTGVVASASQFGQVGTSSAAWLSGSATASWRRDTKTNEDNGTTCGTWSACSVETLPFGTCPTLSLGSGTSAYLACYGPLSTGNRWYVSAEFFGNATYTNTTLSACCPPPFQCPPNTDTAPVGITLIGEFGAGCAAPMPAAEDVPFCSCPDGGLSVFLYRNSGGFAGPFRLQNLTYYDAKFGQRHTFTGSASVSFT